MDPSIGHLAPIIAPHLIEAKSMTRHAALNPETIFAHLELNGDSPRTEKWMLGGVETFITPKRLETFRANLKCVCCGREGNIFLIERHRNDTNGQNLNLYSATKQELMLINVDHILPDSLGGRYDPVNFQTMCRQCNVTKGNFMSQCEIDLVRQSPHTYAKPWIHLPFLHAVLDLQEIILYTTGPKKAKYKAVFNKYRRQIKFDTSEAAREKITNALLQSIANVELNSSNVPPIPLATTRGWIVGITKLVKVRIKRFKLTIGSRLVSVGKQLISTA